MINCGKNNLNIVTKNITLRYIVYYEVFKKKKNSGKYWSYKPLLYKEVVRFPLLHIFYMYIFTSALPCKDDVVVFR